jgi:hypothetical protein
MTAPRRAHVLTLGIDADTHDDLLAVLRQIQYELATGSRTVTSGGYTSGWYYEYTTDETMTRERYVEEVKAYLEARDA